MDIKERLSALASKVKQQKSSTTTEEATKTAFILPFIAQVLGYDIFDPLEVVPEFTSDVGTKKGEKIDYAIVKDGEVQILIETKAVGAPLSVNHASQLFRYFAVSNARVAILTNGEEYHFFTDLDRPNRMDDKPFLQLDLNDLDPTLIPEVAKLAKGSFDIESVVSAAEELKYIGELKRVLVSLFREPDDDWVKSIALRVYEGIYTPRVREQFNVLVRKAMKQFLADQVNERLKAALGDQSYIAPPAVESDESTTLDDELSVSHDRGIETTLEELEGYQIVRAIACAVVSPKRIHHRDTKSYFGILLDDNNRRPLVRLHFNTVQKYVGIFDENREETKHMIESVDEIYNFADAIRLRTKLYDEE